MNKQDRFTQIYHRLKAILQPYEDRMVRVASDAQTYYLDTPHIMKNNKPLFFAAAGIKKNYVSFHLMPVYVFPELLREIPAELKKRMQGKSCFNLKEMDEKLFKELSKLTKSGYQQYKKAGYVA